MLLPTDHTYNIGVSYRSRWLQNPHTSDAATLIVLIFVGDSTEG